jgi:SAM-dependent methyltransferase
LGRFEYILRTGFNTAVQIADPRGWLNKEQFIRSAYRRFLKRDADPSGLAYYQREMQRGLSRWQTIACFVNSPEFLLKMELTTGSYLLHERLHQARCDLVKMLPPARDILDLGGANADNIEGSLLTMGYPYAADTLTIVDLPPADRFSQLPSYADERSGTWLPTARGTKIRYLHRSMTELTDIPDESIDLVWMGQTIEHIEKQEAINVLRQSYRILRVGGYLCLDTPNAAVCRIAVPDGFIFPEHKHEYYVDELADEIRRAGFNLEDVKGLGPMPDTVRTGRFDIMELYRNCHVCDTIEDCYFFYCKCSKGLTHEDY